MAKKISLREFQQGILEKLQNASHTQSSSTLSRLGVVFGRLNWLVNLSDVSEVVSFPTLVEVPLTKSWFAGVANIRGNLFSIVDFSGFVGQENTRLESGSRILLIHQKYNINAGLIVTRMLGLRNIEQLKRLDASDAKEPWVTDQYVDADGQKWTELNMEQLTILPDFLQVGI